MSPATATKRRSVPISHYFGPDPLVKAAGKLRLQVGTVQQLIYGRDDIVHRLAVIVEEMVKAGQALRAERLLVQIDRARHATQAPELNNELCEENTTLEQAEDRSEARFYRDPCAKTARPWRDNLRLENAHNELLIASLEATYPEIA